MTVQSEITRADYLGNGSTIFFTVPFRYLQDGDLMLLRTVIATNVTTVLALNSPGANGYTASAPGDPNGGFVHLVTAPAVGERLTILRDVSITQLINYVNNDPFPAESHETGLDRLTMIVQMLAEIVGRAIVVAPQTIGVSNLLPSPAALNLLRWKADLSGLENVVPPQIATVANGAVVDATVSALAAIQGTKLNFIQSGAGAVNRTMQDKAQEKVSVLDFIPINLHAGIRAATNTTDLKPYIEACFASRSGDVLTEFVFPSGSYFVASAVNLLRGNCNIVGDRAGLTSNNTTSDLLKIGDGVTSISNIDVTGMTFTKSVLSTAGYGVSMDLVTLVRIERCVFYGDNKLFGGVKAHRTIRVKVINCDGENLATGGKGILWTGTVTNQSIDFHVRDNEFYGVPSGIGLDVQDYTEGLYCRRNTFFQCGAAGISVAGASEAATGFSGKIDQNDFDSCGFGLYSQYFDNLSVTNNWFSANTGNNIRMSNGCAGWVINGNQMYCNGQVGMNIEGDDVVIGGNLITAATDAIILASTVSGATITGNSINGNSGYGINKLAAPANVTIVGNTVRANTVDQISTGGTNLNVANNLIV
jgi:hypothetical protein